MVKDDDPIMCRHCGHELPRLEAYRHWGEYMWELLTEEGRREGYIDAMIQFQLCLAEKAPKHGESL